MAPQSIAQSESIAAFIPDLERLIAEAMDEWKIPGLAMTVVQNGEVVLVGAYGLRDVEAGLKVTTDTQFMICSITKSFTSTGLALLVDERRLDWKKPVRDYIPEFRLHDAVATDRITVRDLLCHHSGLPRHDWVHLPADLLPAQMLAATCSTVNGAWLGGKSLPTSKMTSASTTRKWLRGRAILVRLRCRSA